MHDSVLVILSVYLDLWKLLWYIVAENFPIRKPDCIFETYEYVPYICNKSKLLEFQNFVFILLKEQCPSDKWGNFSFENSQVTNGNHEYECQGPTYGYLVPYSTFTSIVLKFLTYAVSLLDGF